MFGNPPNTYYLSATCSNCGATQIDLFIPKGTTTTEFLRKQHCPRCDCPMKQ